MIPPTAHFIWIGSEFSWLSWAAVVTAARRGGFEQVILHHTHDLSRSKDWRRLGELSRVRSVRLDPVSAVERFGGTNLVDRYRALRSPAAESNVLRLAILAEQGGVYLDLDTVTIAPLSPLRAEAGFFCGLEHVAFPASVRNGRNPLDWGLALGRSVVRDLVRRSRQGVRWFRSIQHHYPRAANNAVIGSVPDHPFLRELGDRMLRLTASEARRRYALGTVLLQTALREAPPHDAVVHAPEVFYPLGPELSTRWFRAAGGASLDDVLTARTRVVHWYASVRTRHITPNVDSSWLTGQGSDKLFGLLLRHALATGVP